MKNLLVVTLCVYLIYTTSSTIYVSTNGTDTTDCGTQNKTCYTLSYSLSKLTSLASNETVADLFILPGLYFGPSNRNLTIARNNINIVYRIFGFSVNSSDVVLDASFASPVFLYIFENVEFYNLTFANGHSDSGGCLHLISNATFSNCVFLGCSATNSGGAVYITYSARVLIRNCYFVNNSASHGGAIYLLTELPLKASIENSTFINNNASENGGALYLSGSCDILQSQITYNLAINGGGIYIENHIGTLNGNVIIGNVAHLGGGVFITRPNSLTISNSNVSGNLAFIGAGFLLQGHIINGLVQILRSQISENNATVYGGGIYVNNSSYFVQDDFPYTISVNQSKIVNNRAQSAGGGIYVSSSTVVFPSSWITNNSVDSVNNTFANLFCDESTNKKGFCQVCCDVQSCSDCVNQGVGACVHGFKDTSQSCVGSDFTYCPCGISGIILGIGLVGFVLLIFIIGFIIFVSVRLKRKKPSLYVE